MTTPSAIWRPEVGVEFGKRYLYEIADCLPIVPNMPMRKFPMLMAAAVESFIREAQSHGLVSLSEITPEELVSLIPSKPAIGRAVLRRVCGHCREERDGQGRKVRKGDSGARD